MSKLADSTRKAYATGWRQWEIFMSHTGHSSFWTGETRAEKHSDEAWLILFVVFQHEVMGRTAQGIKQPIAGASQVVGLLARAFTLGSNSAAESSRHPFHVEMDRKVSPKHPLSAGTSCIVGGCLHRLVLHASRLRILSSL